MTARYDLDERQALLRGRLAFQTMFLLMALMLVNACAVSSGLDWGGPFDQVALICFPALAYFTIRATWGHALLGVLESPVVRLGALALGGAGPAIAVCGDVVRGRYSFWSDGRPGEDFVMTLVLAYAVVTTGTFAARWMVDRREGAR